MAEIVDFGLQQHKIKMDSRYFENVLSVVAGDTGRRIEVQLLDTNGMVQNTTGLNLRLNALVAGKATFTDATLVDAATGKYQLDLSNGMFLAPGNWQFQWQITDSAGKKLHSFAFTGNVGSNISEGGNQATNFYLNLEDLKAMQEDLVNGTFDFEVLETNIAEKLTDLETQYAPKLTEVTAQLADNTHQLSDIKNNPTNYQGAVLTFVDDDGQSSFETYWQPILDNKGINISIAVLSDKVGIANYLTKNELLTLQDAGNDLLCHGASGMDYNNSNTTEAVFEADARKGQNWMKENGMMANDYLVYSGGLDNKINFKNIARKYFKYGITAWGTDFDYNKSPVDNWLLARYDGISKDLTTLKAKLDEAIANNGWLIIMTHAHLMNAEQRTKIESLIDYANTRTVPIMKFTDAVKVKGNAVAIGERTAANGVFISANGESTLRNVSLITSNNNVMNDTISTYKKDTITVKNLTYAKDTFLNTGGVMTVYRMNDDTYSYAIFTPYNSNKLYMRKWNNSTSSWGAFEQIGASMGEAFTVVTQNGWTGTLKYSKNSLGQVWVRGILIASSTVGLGTVVGNLPVGYRPAERSYMGRGSNSSKEPYASSNGLDFSNSTGNITLLNPLSEDVSAGNTISINEMFQSQ